MQKGRQKSSLAVGPKKSSVKTGRYLMVLVPILIFWFVLHVYPNIAILPNAFVKWNGLSDVKEYVGLRNFRVIFKSEQWFKKCFFNTSAYIIYSVILQTALALLLALVLRKNTRHNNALRTLYFVPIVLSSVAVSLIWQYMYDPNIGFLHNLFQAMKLEKLADFQYLSGRYQWLFFIAVVQIWAGIGVPITLFTAGFQGIPEEIYEASALDGANGWHTFWDVTLPQMTPTILRVMLLTISGAALSFDYVFMLGVEHVEASTSFDTWAVAIYKSMLGNSDYGMVAANSTVLALFMMIICIVQYVATKHAEDNYM